jgi:hypothetical protein
MSATQKFSIASIPADGVGKEVVSAGRRVLDALAEISGGKFAFEWTEFPSSPAREASTNRRWPENCPPPSHAGPVNARSSPSPAAPCSPGTSGPTWT